MKTNFDKLGANTVLAHAGSHPEDHHGFITPPVYRGSTVVFPDVATMKAGNQRYQYGRWNNPSTEGLAEAISALEGAQGTILCPSGLAACVTSILAVVGAGDLVEATSDTGAFVQVSSVLKRIVVKASKICNDLRLLGSGPQAGLAELQLPARQAGSSIMPGKVNPVIPEMVNQVAFWVIGNDLTVTMAAEAGQLQLNAFEPVMGHGLLQGFAWTAAAFDSLRGTPAFQKLIAP